MFKKRLLPLLGIAAMGTTMLAGCGGGPKFVIWATEAEKAVIDKVIGDYNKTATDEEKISYKFVPVAESDAGTNLLNDASVKNAPALILCADDQLSGLIDNNIIVEVTGEYKTRIQQNNTDVSVTAVTYENKVYGFPVTNDNGYFLWYDATYFDETDVLSLENILQVAETNNKTFLMDVGNGWYANSFIMSPDACGTDSLYWLKDEQGKTYYETNWDSAMGVKVSEYINDLLQPAYANGTGHLVTGSNDKIAAGFQDGTMIAAVSGTWMEADLKAAIGDNLRAAKLPSYHIDGDAYQMTSFTGSKVYAVNRFVEPEYQEMALKVADLLVNYKEAQLQRFEIRQSIPCNKEAMVDTRYTEHKTLGGAALEAQVSVASCVQSLTAQGRYWDIGAAIGTAYLDGDLGEASTWADFLALQCVALRRHVA